MNVRDECLFKVDRETDEEGLKYLRVSAKNPDTLAADLAPRVTQHYFDEEAARERLRNSLGDLSLFSSEAFTERIEEAIAEERDAVLPEAWRDGREKVLDVQRSEFAEIVGAEVLSGLFSTVIPASRIASKEIPDQQTRGADIAGFENVAEPHMALILAEVKGSVAGTTPPGVSYGMVKKLKQLATNRRTLLQELIWLRDHASEEHRATALQACATFQLRSHKFGMLMVPILVRSVASESDSDAKLFRDNPDQFGHPVRWITIAIDEDLFDIAAEIYRIARKEAA